LQSPLGIGLTFATSWFVSLYHPFCVPDHTPSEEALSYVESVTEEHEWFMGEPAVHHVTSRMGRKASVVMGGIHSDSYESHNAHLYPAHEFEIVESGFPFRCFEGSVHRRDNHVMDYTWAVSFGENMITNREMLPLKPMIAPFLMNTVTYAVIAFLLITATCRFINRSNKPDASEGK